MSGRWIASWVALVVCLLAAGEVAAHEFRPAALVLTEHADGDVDVRLRRPVVTVRGPTADALVVRAPSHCTADAEGLRWTCGPRGLSGTVTVEGFDVAPVDVVVTIEHADGRRRQAVLGPDAPTLALGGAQPAASVVADYLRLGAVHILEGIDHLAFVLGLVLLVGARRRLVATVTAFTVGHSLTLAVATLGWWIPPRAPIEAAIALSIVLVMVEVVRGPPSLGHRMPWAVAGVFGLLHGFGFAGSLADVGLPANAVPLALLSFNLGVEAGQLGFVLVLWVVLAVSDRTVAPSRMRRGFARVAGPVAVAWMLVQIADGWGIG